MKVAASSVDVFEFAFVFEEEKELSENISFSADDDGVAAPSHGASVAAECVTGDAAGTPVVRPALAGPPVELFHDASFATAAALSHANTTLDGATCDVDEPSSVRPKPTGRPKELFLGASVDTTAQSIPLKSRKYARHKYEPFGVAPAIEGIDDDIGLKKYVENKFERIGHPITPESTSKFLDQFFPCVWARCGYCKIQSCHWAIRFLTMDKASVEELWVISTGHPMVVVAHERPHCSTTRHTGGSESQQHINKNLRAEARSVASDYKATLNSLVADTHTKQQKYVPPERNISKARIEMKRQEKTDAPAKIPIGLEEYAATLVDDGEECSVWAARGFACFKGETFLPVSFDHLLTSIEAFYSRGLSQSISGKILHYVGDGTHDQTTQRLKKIVIGFAGTNFNSHDVWAHTIIPGVYVICSREAKKAIAVGLRTLEKCLHEKHGLVLRDIVLDWYWDGAPEASAVFSEYFGTPGHLCIQHAKGRYQFHFDGGFSHEVANLIEMISLTLPSVFHVAMEALIAQIWTHGPSQTRGLKHMTIANVSRREGTCRVILYASAVILHQREVGPIYGKGNLQSSITRQRTDGC